MQLDRIRGNCRTGSLRRLFVLFLGAELPLAAQQPCLKKAWDAYKKSDYAAAIQAATECEKFRPDADRQQTDLERKREPLPPCNEPNVPDSDKNRIFAWWAVNDVSAAYWVKGDSAEHLYKQGKNHYRQTATDAYTAATRLTYGRVYDPAWKGFWCPAEKAKDALDHLN